MVITLTNLPAEIEEALQRKAAEEGKTVDRVTLDALTRGLELDRTLDVQRDNSADDDSLKEFAEKAKAVTKELNNAFSTIGQKFTSDKSSSIFEEQRRKATLKPGSIRDLSLIAGTWVDDPEFDTIIEEQRQIDPELWQ